MIYHSRIKVKSTLPILEESGIELDPSRMQVLHVTSHKSKQDLVTVDIDGKTFSVNAEQLTKAIENATNA